MRSSIDLHGTDMSKLPKTHQSDPRIFTAWVSECENSVPHGPLALSSALLDAMRIQSVSFNFDKLCLIIFKADRPTELTLLVGQTPLDSLVH